MAQDIEKILRYVDERRLSLRRDRLSYWQHWQDLATNLLPRRYKWLVTPNQANRGSPINGQILDPTGTMAARMLAAGMLSGICSPARPWFKLSIYGVDDTTASPATRWLAECTRRMMLVLQESNFYTSMGTAFFDLVVFGTMVIYVKEDFDDIIRCTVPCAGEYYLGVDAGNKPISLYREFAQTYKQIIDEFGVENCSRSIQSVAKTASNLSNEKIICHAIEQNSPIFGVPSHFKWVEVYWEMGETGGTALRISGFHEYPFFAARWDVTSNDAYGRSVGMDALPDIKQLQHETKRKGQALDKMVAPPMLADVQMKNQPASLLPGAITYVPGLSAGTGGFKPAYTVTPPLQEIREDIAAIQARIKDIFYNNLFLTVTNLDTVRSAAEIDARRAEQLIMLGPVLERFDNEALTPSIERLFGAMFRKRLIPPPPPEIANQFVKVQFKSMLAESQRTAAASGIERWVAQLGNLAAVDPTVLDNIDSDRLANVYGSYMSVPPEIIRDVKEVEKLRAERAKQQQQQALLQQTLPAVKGAQVLSKTDVGGGQNALAAMLSGANI